MIKNFTDKNGSTYNIYLRGTYTKSIRTAAQLKTVLDRSIAAKTEKLANAYKSKNYMDVMRDFGMISQAKLLKHL